MLSCAAAKHLIKRDSSGASRPQNDISRSADNAHHAAALLTVMPNQLLDNLALDYSLPLRFDGYVVLAIYALVVLAIFFLALRTFRGLGVARWGLLAFLLALRGA